MKRISYTWFHDPRTSNRPQGMFSRFAPAVFRAARAVYSDFELVVHHDSTLDSEPYGPAARRLEAAGVLRLVECQHGRGISEASLWRLKPAWERETDVLLCRDLDSIPTLRERWAVEAWLESGQAAHAINDVAAHVSPEWPDGALLTGTCSFRAVALRQRIGEWHDLIEFGVARGMGMDCYGHDERALNLLLQPLLSGEILGHIRGVSEIVPYPLTAGVHPQLYDQASAFTEYVGMRVSDDDLERAVEWYGRIPALSIFQECGA